MDCASMSNGVDVTSLEYHSFLVPIVLGLCFSNSLYVHGSIIWLVQL